MYSIAIIDADKCTAEKGCRLCIMFCPEPDTILFDPITKKAVVVEDRCKGCELCVEVCSKELAATMIQKH